MSELEKEKERKKEYTYTYIHTHTTIYIPEQFQITYGKLLSILDREGSSISKWFRQQAEPYVRLHELGNPQQTLPTILKLGKAYRANACFFCGGKPEFRAFQGTQTVVVCSSCFEVRKGRFGGWKRFE